MLAPRILCVFLAFKVCRADRVSPAVWALQPTEPPTRTHEFPAVAMPELDMDKANSEHQPSGDVKGDVESKHRHSLSLEVEATTADATTPEETTTTEEATTTTTELGENMKEAGHHQPTDPRLQEAREKLLSIHRSEGFAAQQQVVSTDGSKENVPTSNAQQPVIVKLAEVKNDLQAGAYAVKVNSSGPVEGAGKLAVLAIETVAVQFSFYLKDLPDWLEWTLYLIGVVFGALVIIFLHKEKYRPVHGCATFLCVLYCWPCGFLGLCFPLDEATPEPRGTIVGEAEKRDIVEDESGMTEVFSSRPSVAEPSGARSGDVQRDSFEDKSGFQTVGPDTSGRSDEAPAQPAPAEVDFK